MRTSKYLLSTLKETPKEASVVSHQLMLRAGLIRQLASGLYIWLPTGQRVLNKVYSIIREEMNKSGAIEVNMPVVQPAELWQESGRWDFYGPELCRLKDRKENDFVLGPTHEEIITYLARSEIKSYKQLPMNLYQIQTKFRDEVRPRFGVMRGREFIMKDAYSFHLDTKSLRETYNIMYDTYSAIFNRLGLNFRPVAADTGAIGGSHSHEFQVLADAGEDIIAFSTESDYAANIEMAEALMPTTTRKAPTQEISKISTPNCKTIEEVSNLLKVSPEQICKSLIVHGKDVDGKTPLVMLLLRGDHELNEVKAEKHSAIASPLTMATDEEIFNFTGAHVGSLGPVGFKGQIIADRSVSVLSDFYCGANEDNFHLSGVNFDRDISNYEIADLRNVVEGDPSPDGKGTIVLKHGIEVGQVFELGTKYSEAMNCCVLDEAGKSIPMQMGCYGIGVTRVIAAAIEQLHDEKGILWPKAMAPFEIAIVPVNYHKSEQVSSKAEEIYAKLSELGIEVLLDDRKERPGVMFADMELIGIPHMITIGEKTLATGFIEYTDRKTGEKEKIAIDSIIDFITNKIK